MALGAVGAVPSGVGVVVGGEIPYQPEAPQEEGREPGEVADRDPEIKCYLPGVPRATYMPFPFQIFQSESAFFIAYEYAGAVRNIYLKDPGTAAGRHLDGPVGRAAGTATRSSSTANGFNDQSWFDRAGNHHSEALKVTERYTMTGPDHIQYEATIEDAETFTRPWTIACRSTATSTPTRDSASSSASSSSKS